MPSENTTYSLEYLNGLSNKLIEKWEELFIYLDIEDYYVSDYRINLCCPIHGGDNPTALNLYLEGCNSFAGNWICNTAQCHDIFKRGIINFVRGVLSRKKLGWSSPGDQTISFQHTVQYLLEFLGTDKVISATLQRPNPLNQYSQLYLKQQSINSQVTREQIRSSLQIPAEYYIQRGYSPTILSTYDVGMCTNRTKLMYNRVVIPIYDKDNNYVGCTGRSIWEKCEACSGYHNPGKPCYHSPKWLHSPGFQGSNHLYNYCNAQNYIRESQIMILCEGPGDVLKLEQAGIHNSVAVLKASISNGQTQLINQSGALSIITILDNDAAGQLGAKKIQQQFGRLYRLYFPTLNTNDIGDMNTDQITNEIVPYIETIQKETL